jgi:hypothetical protein
MDKEWKDKWVAALRSGDYKQGTYQLINDNNEYCCLGVLCRLADGVVKEPFFTNVKGDGLMNKEVSELVGLTKHYETLRSLVYFNDIQKNTFSEIADYIESTL